MRGRFCFDLTAVCCISILVVACPHVVVLNELSHKEGRVSDGEEFCTATAMFRRCRLWHRYADLRAVISQPARKKLVRLAATVADLSRERSERNIPFFVMARSLSFMMQRVPVRVWKHESCGNNRLNALSAAFP